MASIAMLDSSSPLIGRHMPQQEVPGAGFRFQGLPKCVRNRIYRIASLEAGVHLVAGSHGELKSNSPIYRASKQLHDEYRTVLYTATPVITADVHDFDFSDVVALCEMLVEPWWEAFPEPLKPMKQTLQIRLMMGRRCCYRDNIDMLQHWAEHFRNVVPSTFETKYTVIEDRPATAFFSKTALSDDAMSLTLEAGSKAQIIEHMLVHYHRTLRGPLKVEFGKIIDALGGRRPGEDGLLEHQEPVEAWHEACPSNRPSNFILKLA